MVRKILFITLSNLGDMVLTFPSLDYLRVVFSEASITVISGERGKELFENNPSVFRWIAFDKHAALREKFSLLQTLQKERFDLIIDLRNSFFGVYLKAQYKTSLFLLPPKQILHMRDRHLYKIQSVLSNIGLSKVRDVQKVALHITESDKDYVGDLLKKNGVIWEDRIIAISVGARSHIKRWKEEKFAELVFSLAKEPKVKMVLVGDSQDAPIAERIIELSKVPAINFTGKTTFLQLASLFQMSACVITNDSAALHLASYLDRPVVAIFGPTDESKYGPWSRISAVVKKEVFCRPCELAQCQFGTLKCMEIIKTEDVLGQVRNILDTGMFLAVSRSEFKRILIVRTDRIGDVVLSTPVIKALRDGFPQAYITMMVSPYAAGVVEGNPYLDEVIVYDKDKEHKSWWSSFNFCRELSRRKFDLAVILHPTNRAHLLAFLAGIPRRVGYDKKLGFLLTDKLLHSKQLGEKHEIGYNLDLVRVLGLDPKDCLPFVPIKPEAEAWANQELAAAGIKKTEKILVIHPGASCPSKIWPPDRFAASGDRLIERYGFKAVIISGPKDIGLADDLEKMMKHSALNLAGKTTVEQMASILKRSRLFISNDSGPVHIASALGVPVVSIFGRSQAGLSPKRWGPSGSNSRILHREVGCIECLAHNCVKGFACLKAITVEDVMMAVSELLEVNKT